MSIHQVSVHPSYLCSPSCSLSHAVICLPLDPAQQKGDCNPALVTSRVLPAPPARPSHGAAQTRAVCRRTRWPGKPSLEKKEGEEKMFVYRSLLSESAYLYNYIYICQGIYAYVYVVICISSTCIYAFFINRFLCLRNFTSQITENRSS